MSASRARKIMLAAIAISLLVHLLFAGYVRWPFAPPNENAIVKVHRITIARVVAHTPPPRTPPPRTPPPQPRVTPLARASVTPPKVAPRASKGVPAVHAAVPPVPATLAPAATPLPTALPTIAAAPCSQHDITPAVSSPGEPVAIPPDARASKESGIAAIAVQIDARGRVTGTSVARSSGNTGLDAVALEMAKDATYSPGLVKCKPVASAYTYTVKFAPW